MSSWPDTSSGNPSDATHGGTPEPWRWIPLVGYPKAYRSGSAGATSVWCLVPDAVIHTATARDDWRITANGAAHVAVATAAAGVRLVPVSGDAVFSGRHGDDDETAQPDPMYPYGAAKAAAETAVRAVAPGTAVVRTYPAGLPRRHSHPVAGPRRYQPTSEIDSHTRILCRRRRPCR
jgi:nucleoside-diphosphate-sugar epimerase